MVVKLAATDVSARIVAGEGQPFAPAGRTFREWVVVDAEDESSWRTAMTDALEYAAQA